MKTIALVASLLFCISAQGGPEDDYSSLREWVEKHCITNAIPIAERLFIVSDRSAQRPGFTSITRFHQGINLREIVDQTPFKQATVTIIVLRRKEAKPFRSFFTLKPSDNPEFEVKPLDVLWILGERRAEPDGAANGSQPIRSETNSTPSAAGPRR